MKYTFFALFAILIACPGCNDRKIDNDDISDSELLRRENDSLKQRLDSVTKVIAAIDTSNHDKPAAKIAPRPEPVPLLKPPAGGTHPITLHWISWDRPGKAIVTPIDGVWYKISGKQNNAAGDYLTIDGKIRRIAQKELEFDGTITTRTATTNHGKPCTKSGVQRFFGKGSRNYYRLQDMENCEGGMLVDYIDIYPGTSSL